MILKRKYIFLLFCMIFTLSSSTDVFAFEKVGVTSFQFLKVMPGARSTALGNAYSSLAHGADAMFWNPAGLIKSNKFGISASHIDWFLDTQHFSFSGVYSLSSAMSIGIMGMNVDYGEIEVTTVDALGPTEEGYNPGLTGETIHPGANLVGLAFGQRLTNKFSYGVTAKYVTENMDVKSKSILMFDGGVLFDTKFRSMVLSATIRHFGPKVTYYDKDFPLPQTLNIGISANIISPQESLIGTTSNHSILMAFDIVQPRDYDQQYNIGFEYSFSDILFLRSGYRINYDTGGLTLGFGIKYKSVKMDYSYNDFGDYLDNVNRFTVGFEL